jgi:hypothetical protein
LSNLAWGILELATQKAEQLTTIELGYHVVACANDCRIGIKLGWNISDRYLEIFKSTFQGDLNKYLPFEILDNPVSNVAHLLFSGEGVSDYSDNPDYDARLEFEKRLKRLQCFFSGLFAQNWVKEVTLIINGMDGLHPDIQVEVGEFSNVMIAVLEVHNRLTPNVKFKLFRKKPR